MAGLWSRKPRIATRLGVLALVVLLGSYAAAQTVYKWTDDNGVVHFSDMPPPPGTHFEKRDVPPPPPAPTAAAAGGEAGAAAENFEGPARVILTSNNSFPSGDTSRHVIGVVKNVGGEEASNVHVTVRITDDEGNECVTQDVAIAPSTLEPGASGNFDTTLDNPCLAGGGGNVDAAPKWE